MTSVALDSAKSIEARIAQRKCDDERGLHEHYWNMVRDTISGKPVDVDTAADVWSVLGINRERFHQDCEKQRQRSTDAQLHSTLPQLRAELAKVQREQELADAKLTEYINRERRKLADLSDRSTQLAMRVMAAESASQRLFSSFRDPSILERERELSARRVELQTQVNECTADLRKQISAPLEQMRAALQEAKKHAATMQAAGHDPRNAGEIQRLRAGIRQLEQRESEGRRRIAELHAESDRLQTELTELAKLHYIP